MKSVNHIITFLLCIIITYTGSGFAEIQYNCVGCIDEDLQISRLFFPTKINAHNRGVHECGTKSKCTLAKTKSCCEQTSQSQSPEKKDYCRETKISKLDITKEDVSVCTDITSYVALNYTELYDFALKSINDNQSETIKDNSPPPLSGLYPIIYCTLLI